MCDVIRHAKGVLGVVDVPFRVCAYFELHVKHCRYFFCPSQGSGTPTTSAAADVYFFAVVLTFIPKGLSVDAAAIV